MAHRSPTCAGIGWAEIARIVSTDSNTGRVIRGIRPQVHSIHDSEACGKLDGCADLSVDVFLSRDSWRKTTKEVNVGDWADFDFEPIETTSGDLSGGAAGRAEHACCSSRKKYITDRNRDMLEDINRTGHMCSYLAHRFASTKHSVSFSRDISSCMMCKRTGGACIEGCTCTTRVRRQLLSCCVSTQSQCHIRNNNMFDN